MKHIDKFKIDNCVFVRDTSEPDGIIGILAPNNQTFEGEQFANEFVFVWNQDSEDKPNFSVSVEKLNGLLLSEKVLAKLGFVHNENIFSLSPLTIKNASQNHYEVNCKGGNSVSISYVHQLQNYCRVIGEIDLLHEFIKPLIGMTHKAFRQQYE